MISIDLVCGAAVQQEEARRNQLFAESGAMTFYFCSSECKRKFQAQPETYIQCAQSLQDEDVEGEVDRAWE